MAANIKTLYINESFMRERIVIPNGVSEQNLLRSIRMAQAIYLVDVLGTDLYASLETHVVDGTLTDAGNEDWVELMGYVKEWMVYRAAHLSIDLIADGDNLTEDYRKEGGLTDTYEGAYGAIQGRMVAFIKDKTATFESIIKNGNGYDDFNDKSSGFPTFIPDGSYADSGDCGECGERITAP